MAPRDMHFPSPHMRSFRPSPEYRLCDLNKRLSMRHEDCDQQWWEAFANEFFEDDALFSLYLSLEEGTRRFSINRVLLPRFFRTLFDGGVSDVYFLFKHPREMCHPSIISFDCEQGSMVTQVGKPTFIKLYTDGHFTIDFTLDDLMRIKSWQFTIRQFHELIPRSVVAIPTDNPAYLDQMSKNFTRFGLTSSTLNFLRFCEVLEPMQELMSRQKTTAFSPRDCLKTILHQRWSKTCSDPRPVEEKPRRKKKSNNSTKESPTLTKKRSSVTSVSPPNSTTGDVMIVGEPSLMGGEMEEEDERFISRLENNSSETTNNLPTSHPIKREQVSPALPSLFTNNTSNSNPSTPKAQQNILTS